MSWRWRFYRSLKDSPGAGFRWFMANLLVFFGFGALVVVLDLRLGSPEMRWSLDVWFGFLTGFSAVAVFNIVLELLGLGYAEWRERTRDGV